MLSSDGIRYVRRPVNKRDDVKYQVPTVKHGGDAGLLFSARYWTTSPKKYVHIHK